MEILKELENLEEKEDLILELKRQNLPLVMWGAGEFAEEVNEYLKQHDIFVDDVFVDDDYYLENKLFDERPVISYSMLRKKYNLVNLIFGHSSYEKKGDFEQIKCFNKVFCFFSINYGVHKKTSKEEIEENLCEFESSFSTLSDEKSRRNFLAFLKTRISGNNSYVMNEFEKNSNFFNNDIFRIGKNEVLLDVGAYDGDTIRLFLKENKREYKHIYAVEPDDMNRIKLERYIQKNSLNNVSISGIGAWKEEGVLNFTAVNEQISGMSSRQDDLEADSIKIKVDQLDKIFQYKEKITVFKINYFEGVKEAIEGARNILKMHKPKIAVTVGFDCRNIRFVPNLIKEINSEYNIYLRFNRGMVSSLTCYGSVDKI